ncbi:VTC domain-containing protein [Suillus paluster]|uniref:VTC domain-containing protein n=1 Tax=Suillus paluster TaxID=48578 RepID=UPI001B87DEA6|nr:VTC domain-containing protein [Suillus paluster]KAG1725146.1 VTC domain-containing protein [Suillus paluster]
MFRICSRDAKTIYQAKVDSMIQLASEVQYRILTKQLQPVMRTFYNRTAFQLPGDPRVRISLDTEFTMARGDNWDSRSRAGDNWRRTDIGIDHPFDQLPAEDKELFKYGVLEVKLQTQFGQEPPKWVTDLVQSYLVEAVPKFSKFIHGCATLLPNRVDLVPFWLPQTLTRVTSLSSAPQRAAPEQQSGVLSPVHSYVEPVSEGEEDEEMDLAPARDEFRRTGLPHDDVAAAYRIPRRSREEVCDERTPLLKMPRPPLSPSSAFDERLRERFQAKKNVPPRAQEERLLVRDWTAPPGKRIAVPVRVEPKVYFANERTFLKWLSFAVLIGSIATTLLNFVDADDPRGLISAALFTLAALLAIAYSAIIFVYRAIRLRARSAEGLYYDKYGPTILCFVLLAALGTNIGLRVAEM